VGRWGQRWGILVAKFMALGQRRLSGIVITVTKGARRMKDHEIKQAIDDLTHIAIKYNGSPHLKDCIASIVYRVRDSFVEKENKANLAEIENDIQKLREHVSRAMTCRPRL
jgi:hypothetical protein